MSKPYRSWGYTPSKAQQGIRPAWRDFKWPSSEKSCLAFGNGRSYGDSCLNSDGQLIDTKSLNKIISFDEEQGVLACEAGLLLADLLELVVPRGWFVPVTPGTSFVTVGGAVANDVHGKNHHRDGCFGNHLLSFELRRSSGETLHCSHSDNVDLFRASIGGLGMTGLITAVEIKLMAIQSSQVEVETVPFNTLSEFVQLSKQSGSSHQYTVAWLDCMSSGKAFGRGIFLRANHKAGEAETEQAFSFSAKTPFSVPFSLPSWCLSAFSVRCFNSVYYFIKSKITPRHSDQDLQSFFFPLDAVRHWNRIYGKRGFYQCQFVVPTENALVLEEILQTIVDSGQSSFLAVLKEFGERVSPGLLSFPMQGLCLALDFPDRGDATKQLLSSIEKRVLEAGGALYPAKDRHMSAEAFQAFYPRLEEFKQYTDPGVSSDFWRRVNG